LKIHGYEALYAKIAMMIVIGKYAHLKYLIFDPKVHIVIRKKTQASAAKTAVGIGPQNEPSGFTYILTSFLYLFVLRIVKDSIIFITKSKRTVNESFSDAKGS